ncbi:hypothetical protein, partial [Salmonella enterica]|uniref:hypothetical protein n=1 Tax=Salmonella enterica TaxID=28901 RepID=UPI003FD87343
MPVRPATKPSTSRATARRGSSSTRGRANGARNADAGLGERPESLTGQAYRRIEELIVTLELPPGTAISEA